MTHLIILFWIVIICICRNYVKSIDFLNPTSSINCGTSGEDCNLNCTTGSAGCISTNITLYNNANFNLLCRNKWSCKWTSIYAYNVSNMQLIMDGGYSGGYIKLFVEGTQSNTINLYCQADSFACVQMEVRLLAPNLNFNIHCQYQLACYSVFVSGKL